MVTSKLKRKTDTHYIYLIKCGDFLKIGRISKPKYLYKRISELSVGNPNEIHPICLISSTYIITESSLHSKFDKLNVSGEWFEEHIEIYKHFYRLWATQYLDRKICSSNFLYQKIERLQVLTVADHKGFDYRRAFITKTSETYSNLLKPEKPIIGWED